MLINKCLLAMGSLRTPKGQNVNQLKINVFIVNCVTTYHLLKMTLILDLPSMLTKL